MFIKTLAQISFGYNILTYYSCANKFLISIFFYSLIFLMFTVWNLSIMSKNLKLNKW